MSKKIIGITVGTPIKPQVAIEKTEQATQIEQNTKDIADVKSDFNEHTGNTTSHVTSAERTAWNNKSNFSGSYNDLSNKPTIPTKTSQLTNDSGFLTQHQSLSGYAKTSDIPTKTSQIMNDSGFLTQHQDLSAYAKKTELPTVPTSLKNPYSLTMNAGGTTYTYDGSKAISITIDDGNEVAY